MPSYLVRTEVNGQTKSKMLSLHHTLHNVVIVGVRAESMNPDRQWLTLVRMNMGG